jgi:hypothetical protein
LTIPCGNTLVAMAGALSVTVMLKLPDDAVALGLAESVTSKT